MKKQMGLILIVVAGLVMLWGGLTPVWAAPEKPNILLILVDNLVQEARTACEKTLGKETSEVKILESDPPVGNISSSKTNVHP